MEALNHDYIAEHQLLAALLKRAVYDLTGSRAIERRQAEEWFFGGLDPEETFSFEWVCNQLNLDSGRFVSDMRRVQDKGLDLQSTGHNDDTSAELRHYA